MSSDVPPVLQVIVGSTRPGRIGLPVARWVESAALAHGGFRVELVDLADVRLPLLDEPRHPKLGDYEHQHTRDWSATIRRADAFAFGLAAMLDELARWTDALRPLRAP